MSSALTDLCRYPIVQAPMAGGASCPQLAAAVSEAGGLGFLAGGYKSVDVMYEEVKHLRGLTSRPFGVNLFMPQPHYADSAAVEVYRNQLAGEATWYETPLGDPESGRDDGYEAKLAILLDDPVPVVSFTFGCPTRTTLDAFAKVGTLTVVTVTTPEEAQTAQWSGAGAVCVQGVEAGGHQGTHRDDPESDGAGLGLLSLLTQVKETVELPVIATGGIMRGGQIAAVLAAGADVAQLGTAFLVCPESGANALHKDAMTNPLFVRTELTRAFSGRPARGLVNRFMREHGRYAPPA
jgi:nitronate monooxygenase